LYKIYPKFIFLPISITVSIDILVFLVRAGVVVLVSFESLLSLIYTVVNNAVVLVDVVVVVVVVVDVVDVVVVFDEFESASAVSFICIVKKKIQKYANNLINFQ
jgi:hypothetical protein